MNEKDFSEIEQKIGFTLPEFYKETIRSYPFGEDSFAEEMLTKDLKYVFENCLPSIEKDGKFFAFGGDGSEEIYYLKPLDEKVYVYDIETRLSNVYAPSWKAYLNKINEIDEEILLDQKNYGPYTKTSHNPSDKNSFLYSTSVPGKKLARTVFFTIIVCVVLYLLFILFLKLK